METGSNVCCTLLPRDICLRYLKCCKGRVNNKERNAISVKCVKASKSNRVNEIC